MNVGECIKGSTSRSFARVYLKTVNTPKQRVFSTCWAPFFLQYPEVFLQKNGFIRRKILAVGHISGFQIDPKRNGNDCDHFWTLLPELDSILYIYQSY